MTTRKPETNERGPAVTPEELDELDAIHHSATSQPWNDEWEIVEEPDEYGYYPQREVRAEKDGMHLATFAYLQHLELFLAALRLPELTAELRTLRRLADAARRWIDAAERMDINEVARAEAAIRAALARLDGEDTG